MYKTRKHLTLFLALAMLLSLGVSPAFAAEDPSPLGTIADNVYTNSYFDLAFTMPEGWTVVSEQEQLANTDIAAVSYADVSNEQVDQYLETNSSMFLLSATSGDSMQTVNAQLLSSGGIGDVLSEEEMIDLTLDSLDLGIEGAKIERNSYVFAGQEHAGISVAYTDSSMGIDIDMYMQIVILTKGDYMLMVLMGSAMDDTVAEMTSMFTPLSGSAASVLGPGVSGETGMLGHVDGTTYTNSFFGLVFSAPEDWEFDTEQTLLTEMGVSAASFADVSDADTAQYLTDNDSVYVTDAMSGVGLQTVSIQLLSADGLGEYLSEEDLVELMTSTMDLGIEGAAMTTETVEFGGEEHTALHVEYTDSSAGFDLDMYIEIVMLLKDDYLMMVLMGSAMTNELANLAGMFTVVSAE